MINVVLLGFGNLNHHLFLALEKAENVRIKQVFNRNQIGLPSLYPHISFTDDIIALEPADIYIIGIPDDAIGPFSQSLPFQNKLVVHTSGGVPMDELSKKNRRGVFYPLQTFSKQRKVDFREIPICIEAAEASDLELLQKLGNSISENVLEISSEKRLKLHLAAVFVNNFTNHLYRIGDEILKKEDLSFDLLKPLIMETASKIEHLSPAQAQTGPGRRNDQKTIQKHLGLLGEGEYRDIYEMFTQALTSK